MVPRGGTGPSAPEPLEPRTLRLGHRSVPVLLPSGRDPRLHVAAVIVTVQVLGQVVLGFDVSIAQILVALGVCAAIEIPLTFWARGVLAWPASALLTGNGVALLLRTPGTEHGDWWSLNGLPIWIAAAAVSLLSKYAIVHRGHHLFNPSNFGLVVVFVVFGSSRADPQDLWWGPWAPGLALTVAVIVVGGLTLARRLGLFHLALTFWLTFAAGIAVVAAAGHQMTARWSVDPVAGLRYWTILVVSPEIIIFVFFMITDPKTAPTGHRARAAYAVLIAVLAAAMAAASSTEFATKVSLLGALTLVCAVRPLLDRRFGEDELVTRRGWSSRRVAGAVAAVAAVAGLLVAVEAVGPGAPTGLPASVEAAASGERPEVDLPVGALDDVRRCPSLDAVSVAMSDEEASAVARDVLAGLAIENRARRDRDPELAATASFGPRLEATRSQIDAMGQSGEVAFQELAPTSIGIRILRDPVSPQAIPQLGVEIIGTARTYVDSGDRVEEQGTSQLSHRVLMTTEVGDHYLIRDEVEADAPMVVDDGCLDDVDGD